MTLKRTKPERCNAPASCATLPKESESNHARRPEAEAFPSALRQLIPNTSGYGDPISGKSVSSTWTEKIV